MTATVVCWLATLAGLAIFLFTGARAKKLVNLRGEATEDSGIRRQFAFSLFLDSLMTVAGLVLAVSAVTAALTDQNLENAGFYTVMVLLGVWVLSSLPAVLKGANSESTLKGFAHVILAVAGVVLGVYWIVNGLAYLV